MHALQFFVHFPKSTDMLSGKNGGFDIILMNMSMHDVATLEPLAKYLPKLLKKDGM